MFAADGSCGCHFDELAAFERVGGHPCAIHQQDVIAATAVTADFRCRQPWTATTVIE